MPDDQTTLPIDDSEELEETEDALEDVVPNAAQQMQSGPSGPEQQSSPETQKSVDSQTNSELPPFIQKTLSDAKDGRQQAQQVKDQNLSEAVKIEEQVLGELSALAGLAPSEHSASNTEPDTQPEIKSDVISEEAEQAPVAGVIPQAPIVQETPQPAPAEIVRMADNLRPEVKQAQQAEQTTERREQRSPEIESDTGRDATVALLSAIIEKLDAGTGSIDKLAVENSEEALFRMIQKDALKLILERVREGQWDSSKSMESLAMKMGIFSIIGLFRELKVKTTNESTRLRIQQAIDYMLNENDKLDLEDAQTQKASDAVVDDTYSDPQVVSTNTTVGTVTINDDDQNGTISTDATVNTSIPPNQTPVAPSPQVDQNMQAQQDIEGTVSNLTQSS